MCSYPLYNVFLPYYLEAHGANLGDGSNYQTYRDLAISSVVGILGPLLSAYLVQLRKLRHQGTLFITGCICAVLAGLFTQVRTGPQNIGFSCMINFWLNAVYAVVYAYAPVLYFDGLMLIFVQVYTCLPSHETPRRRLWISHGVRSTRLYLCPVYCDLRGRHFGCPALGFLCHVCGHGLVGACLAAY